jgi:hypothetical protein
LIAQLCLAQTEKDCQRPYVTYIELGANMGATLQKSSYSASSPYLSSHHEVEEVVGFTGRVGVRFLERHDIGLGVEPTKMINSFRYNGSIGGGGTGYEMYYQHVSLQYSYNLLNSKRFALRPLVQAGVGLSAVDREFLDDVYYQAGTTPENYRFVAAEVSEQQEIVFMYGVGAAFEWEIMDDRLSIGLSTKLIHSPYNSVSTRTIGYQQGTEPYLETESYGRIMNLNMALFLRGYF